MEGGEWRRHPGGAVRSVQVIAGLLPDTATLTFGAIQTYSDGTVVKWIESPAPGSSAEPDHPAPAVVAGRGIVGAVVGNDHEGGEGRQHRPDRAVGDRARRRRGRAGLRLRGRAKATRHVRRAGVVVGVVLAAVGAAG